MSHIEKEKLIKADIASIENRVRHAFNQGYDLGFKDGKERAKAQELTIKNNLRVDAISRADAIRVASGYCHPSNIAKELAKLPPVTPQEPQSFKWCDTCKEYDQENHCCHRWSKVIRDTVAEMKHKYIERDVLDKIRAEIDKIYKREGNSVDCLNALDELKWVIDKYKAESEDKNE